MNGNYKLNQLKTMSSQLFDWEHSSRNTNETVPGLNVDDDGTIELQSWLGLTPKGYTMDESICPKSDMPHLYRNIAIALEHKNGEWFWMHISDYSISKR